MKVTRKWYRHTKQNILINYILSIVILCVAFISSILLRWYILCGVVIALAIGCTYYFIKLSKLFKKLPSDYYKYERRSKR